MPTVIPEGLRCYEVIEILDFAKGEAVIKQCEYWMESGDGRYKCKFLGIQCNEGDEDFKIWDNEKECNVNMYNNVQEPEFYIKV